MTGFEPFWQYGYLDNGWRFAYYREQDNPTLIVSETCSAAMNPGERIRLGSEERFILQIDVSSEVGLALVLTGERLQSPFDEPYLG